MIVIAVSTVGEKLGADVTEVILVVIETFACGVTARANVSSVSSRTSAENVNGLFIGRFYLVEVSVTAVNGVERGGCGDLGRAEHCNGYVIAVSISTECNAVTASELSDV